MNNKKHNHEEGFECEACKNGIDAVKKKEAAFLKNPGWFAHYVPDPEYPYGMNVHTHGLEQNFKHPDLQICLGMDQRVCHHILNNAIDEIKKGNKFEAGEKYDNVIESSPAYKDLKLKVLFLEAEECGRKVLRMIFPEKDGSFMGQMSSKQMEGCKVPEDLILYYTL